MAVGVTLRVCDGCALGVNETIALITMDRINSTLTT
jgi:hypothetical protein